MRLSVGTLRRVVKGDLNIEFVQQDLTSYGGLELLRRYLGRIDLPRRLRRAFTARVFTIDNIPSNPKLRLDFKVVRKGRCPITYRATSIYLNKRLLEQIDFRKFTTNDDKSVTIDIPPKTLKVGDNQLLIRTGWCQYDIDVLRLNNLTWCLCMSEARCRVFPV